MKKHLFFALFTILSATAFAQFSGIGFRPSLTLSTYKLSKEYSDLYDGVLRPGAGLAAFAEFNLGNRFTVQPEIAFMQRGANLVSESSVFWDGDEFGYSNDYKVTQHKIKETLNYIDVPIMFEKNFGGGRFGAYLAVGPSFSFAIGGKGREEITLESTIAEGDTRKTDRFEYTVEMGSGRNDLYKAFDLGLNAGGGMLFILDRGEIGLDLRYCHGLKLLNTDGFKNRSLLFGISYMHYIGQ